MGRSCQQSTEERPAPPGRLEQEEPEKRERDDVRRIPRRANCGVVPRDGAKGVKQRQPSRHSRAEQAVDGGSVREETKEQSVGKTHVERAQDDRQRHLWEAATED